MISDSPSFFRAGKVGKRYMPNIVEAIRQGQESKITPVTKNARGGLLSLIDPQDDFVMRDGKLPVKGAIFDIYRVIRLVYNHPEQIDQIVISLDQHLPNMIFFSTWWVGPDGSAPRPLTRITWDDVRRGRWMPRFKKQWSRYYVKKLGEIWIWPFHCMLGTEGANVVSALAEAIAWHAAARNYNPIYILKGMIPESEFFGPFQCCVPVPGHPEGNLNIKLLDEIACYKRIFIAGEAEDFCVREGLCQMIGYYERKNPKTIKKIHLLKDCTSLVFPEKRDEADKILAGMTEKGVKIINSTEFGD